VLGRRDSAGLLRTQRVVVEHARAFAPDVVHGHDAAPTLWMYLRAAGRTRPPVVLTLHTPMTRHFAGSEPGLRSLQTLLRGADAVTAVSRGVADDATALEPSVADRIAVVPNGIVPPRHDPPPISELPPHIVCVGRLVEGKGFEHAVAALAVIARRVPDVRLTIVGDGPVADDLDRQAAALGVDALVERTGHVSHDRVLDVIASGTLVMMPSHYEGLPLVAVEAAWMGRPVVAAHAPGLNEAVLDGETGLLVDPDAESLAAAALQLIGDGALALELGQNARRRAEREWALTSCVDRYESIYRRQLSLR
jgi:glycosyltransferase involved in cell wall biosynthesis